MSDRILRSGRKAALIGCPRCPRLNQFLSTLFRHPPPAARRRRGGVAFTQLFYPLRQPSERFWLSGFVRPSVQAPTGSRKHPTDSGQRAEPEPGPAADSAASAAAEGGGRAGKGSRSRNRPWNTAAEGRLEIYVSRLCLGTVFKKCVHQRDKYSASALLIIKMVIRVASLSQQ